MPDGTYELCGPHFQGNPEGFPKDVFIPHGKEVVELVRPLTFDSLEMDLAEWNYEGFVWWKDGEPRCKLRRGDYGLTWGGR